MLPGASTAVPLETGWQSPSLAVFGSGLCHLAMDAWCLDEKAFVGLLSLQRAVWGTAPALSTATS